MNLSISTEMEYVLLILGLFIIAKCLQRFRLPGAITCVGIGVVFGIGFGALQNDPVVKIFAVLGITILFLFAGMELDIDDLRREARVLIGHVVVQTVATIAVAWIISQWFFLEVRIALLVSLALMSPSTGFILESLASLGVNDKERFWIKSKAIATEIVALIILLFVLQSSSGIRLTISVASIVAMILFLPLVFRVFASHVLPYAPKTEFAFLVAIALICAAATKKLGVYYLIGAFVVGMTEQRLRRKLPGLASSQVLHAIELFASFFIPFYFFKVGLSLRPENFALKALLLGGIFLVTALPIRIFLVAAHRRISLKQSFRKGMRLGVSLLPTLVFTLVIAQILRDRFAASPSLIGGLVIYALVNTLIPGLILRMPPVEYETPEAPPDPFASTMGNSTDTELTESVTERQ